MSRAPTLRDIAQAANVSVSTASAILAGTKSNTRFATATRDRVLAVSTEMGYQANAVARSLRRQQSGLIGLYIGYVDENLGGAFGTAVIEGAHRACRSHDQDLVLFTGHHDRDPEHVFRSLNNGNVDGLLLVGPTEDPLCEMIAESRVKAVTIANVTHSIPAIVVDDAAGGRLQANCLFDAGHRKVIYRTSRITGSSMRRRFEAFRMEAKRLTMEVLDTAHDESELGDFERLWLSQSPRPTALVGWEDGIAHLAIEALTKHGLRVPEDVAVIGFNSSEMQGCAPPAYRLTTIAAPWRQVAETAVEVLRSLMEGRVTPNQTVFPVELVRGDTV